MKAAVQQHCKRQRSSTQWQVRQSCKHGAKAGVIRAVKRLAWSWLSEKALARTCPDLQQAKAYCINTFRGGARCEVRTGHLHDMVRSRAEVRSVRGFLGPRVHLAHYRIGAQCVSSFPTLVPINSQPYRGSKRPMSRKASRKVKRPKRRKEDSTSAADGEALAPRPSRCRQMRRAPRPSGCRPPGCLLSRFHEIFSIRLRQAALAGHVHCLGD